MLQLLERMKQTSIIHILAGGTVTLAASFLLVIPSASAYTFLPKTDRDSSNQTDLTLSVKKKEKNEYKGLSSRTQHLANQFAKRVAGSGLVSDDPTPQEIAIEEMTQKDAASEEPMEYTTSTVSTVMSSAPAKIRRAPQLANSGLGTLFAMSAALGAAFGLKNRERKSIRK